MADNSIGTAEFTFLSGQPVAPSQQIDGPIVRPGIDGSAFWRTGSRGKPFQLRSRVDVADATAANAAMASYLALVGNVPVDLVKEGFSSSAGGWQVLVLGVNLVIMRTTPIIVGGVNVGDGNPGCWLEADWDLIAIPIET